MKTQKIIIAILFMFIAVSVNSQGLKSSITGNPNPVAKIDAFTNPSDCLTNDGSITASGAGVGGSYLWNDTQTEAIAVNLGGGLFTVTVTNEFSCTDQISQELVSPGAPIGTLTSSDVDNIICAGESVEFTVTTTASEIRFLNNGVEARGWMLSTDTGAELYTTTSLIDGDIISAEVRDGSCVGPVTGITITVNPNPVAKIDAFTNPSDCLTNDGSITASGAGVGGSYLWNDTQTEAIAVNLGGGLFTVTVTNEFSCTDQISQELVSPGAPIGTLASSDVDNIICAGESVEFTVITTASEIRFLNNGVEARGWMLSTDTGAELYTTTSLIDGDIISAEVRDGSCVGPVTGITITVNPNPVAKIDAFTNPSDCLTNDGSITASGAGVGGSYLWNDTQTEAIAVNLGGGLFTVTVTNEFSCTDQISQELVSPGAPIGTLTSSDVDNIICAGESVEFTVITTASEIRFLNNGVEARGWMLSTDTGAELYTTTSLIDGDIISAEVRDGSCVGPVTGITITVNPNPVATVTEPIDGCVGEELILTVTYSGGSGLYDVSLIDNVGNLVTGQEAIRSNVSAGTQDFVFNVVFGKVDYTFTIVDSNGCEVK